MRPLKRPMFRTGGPIKEGVMNGLRDGGVATTMADATGYAGGGKVALVGNPIFPKGPDGRAMHANIYSSPEFTGNFDNRTPRRFVNLGGGNAPRTTGGLTNTNVAQNISRTKKAVDAMKGLKGKNLEKGLYEAGKKYIPKAFGVAKNIGLGTLTSFPATAYGSAVMAGPKIISEMMRPKTYAALEYMKEMNQSGVMDETAGTEDFQAFGEELNRLNDTSKYTALPERSIFSKLNPFSITAGLKGDREKAQDIVKQDEEKIKKAEAIVAAAGDTSGLNKEQKEKLKVIEKQNEKDKLDRIYKLLGVDKAQKNAASKALIDMSRYIDEGGKETISKKNIGSTISKAIGAFDKRLDKVDQLKEAAGLMIAKGEIEKDIFQSKEPEAIRTAKALGISTDEYRKKVLGKSSMADIMAQTVVKQGAAGINSDSVEVAYRSSTGDIPIAKIKDKDVREWKKDNEGKTEVDYISEITDRKPGAYIVGTRVVIVDKDLKPSFYY